MSGFRNRIIYNTSRFAAFVPTVFLQKISNQRLILPFYHTISNQEILHIKHLYKVKGEKAFISDLDFLLKHYKPIDYIEFEDLSNNKRQPQKPSFLLSFDDGLKEFHDIIAPILIKKGIPAICFVNSAFIDNKDLFFRYKASILIDKLINEPNATKNLSSFLDKSTNIISKILSITYDNKTIIDEMAHLVSLDFNDYLSKHTPYLSTEQITSLIKQGFHFGAHSIDHPEYQYIELSEQIRQTKESIEYICEKFSLNYKTFSFPFTDHNVSKDFFYTIQKNNIANYTFGCAGQKKDVIHSNFQRIPFEMNDLSAKEILNAELFYYLLKIPLKKNIISRND